MGDLTAKMIYEETLAATEKAKALGIFQEWMIKNKVRCLHRDPRTDSLVIVYETGDPATFPTWHM